MRALFRSAAGALLALALIASTGAAFASESASEGHGHAEQGHHEFNWYYGFIGVREGVEPNLLFRAPGTPPPFGASLVNTALLFFLLFRYGARPVQDALKKRKTAIMQGMDDAARMKREAEERLTDLEDKLDHIDDEVDRVRTEMQAAGKAERERVLADAGERRQRMERDAQLLVGQERKVAQDALLRETVDSAVSSAREAIEKALTPAEHRRLAEEYLAGLEQALAAGGRTS